MNTIRTNINAAVSHNSMRLQNQSSLESMNRLSTGNRITSGSTNAASYTRSGTAIDALRTSIIAAQSINQATALINSVDTSAALIESQLQNMLEQTMRVSDTLIDFYAGDKGIICDYLQQASESIIDIANNHNFGGKNFMVGGNAWPAWQSELRQDGTQIFFGRVNTQPDETTTALNFNLLSGGGDSFTFTLKSFHPYSTVSVNRPYSLAGRFYGSVAAPNIPVLNKTAGTDTHAYGDAALYHGDGAGNPYVEGHLHTDTKAAAGHTILQLNLAIEGITRERSRLGSIRSRLIQMADANQNTALHATNTKSLITDAEFASNVAQLSKSQILTQTTTAMLAQANLEGSRLLELLR